MLLNLRRPTKKKTILKLPGAFAAPFNPIILPGYRAGYMMNYTTDVPAGSINPLVVSAQWFDAVVLGAGSKLMSRGSGTVTGLVNGFKCIDVNTSNGRLRNTTTDILTGVQNYSYVLGFKRNLATTGHMLLSSRNDADTIGAYSLIQSDGKLRLTLGSGANSADAITANRYDDNAWHAIVCVIDQNSKSARIITNTGEDVTNVDALLPAPINFTMTNQSYFQFGAWWVAGLNFTPGFFGDIITFNYAFSNSMINAMLAWECNRLGIVHVPI